ncbi:MAG: hypothetical protein Q9201_002689 [Fulgogasparrea decipioides]
MSRLGGIPLSDISTSASHHDLTSQAENPFDESSHGSHDHGSYIRTSDHPESPINDRKNSIVQYPDSLKPSLYERFFTDSWGLEICSWSAATLLLVILLILLKQFDDKSLSQWHSRLSLNTIIAVLSQLAQSCLLVPIASGLRQLQWLWYRTEKPLKDLSYFDESSRGVIESVILLFKRSTSLIVWLGVISMILQALIGPFAQQALALPERKIKRGEANISRVLSFDSWGEVHEDVLVAGSFFPDVPQSMKLAVLTGLFRDSVNESEVQGQSITGNSTFEIYTSMGVCAVVEDVTSTIVTDCGEGRGGSTISDDKCTATVKGLQKHPPFETFSSHMPKNKDDTLWIGASQGNVRSGYTYQDSDNTLVEFYVIYLPDISVVTMGDTGTIVPYTMQSLQALKGTLKLCAYTYNSTMEFGVTKTVVVKKDTELKWTNGRKDFNGTSKNGIVATAAESSENLWMDLESMAGLSTYLATQTFNGSARMLPPPDNKPGSNVVYSNPSNIYSTVASKSIASHLYNADNKVTDGSGSLSRLLDNMATSMTNG